MRQQRHLHVLDHGQRGEGGGYLESSSHAHMRDLARRQADQLGALQAHRTRGGVQLAVDHIEGGGLACAVGADQREQLAFVKIKADIVYGDVATEFLGKVSDFEQAHAAFSLTFRRRASRFSNSCLKKPAMPCGKASTSINMTPPNMACQYWVAPRK